MGFSSPMSLRYNGNCVFSSLRAVLNPVRNVFEGAVYCDRMYMTDNRA